MTKHKKIGLSVLLKIWLAIMGIVVAVLLLLWGLQVVFLEQYYVGLKQNDLSALTGDIISEIDEKGFLTAQNSMMKLAGNNRLCIEVVTDDNWVLKVEGLAYDCYLHQRNRNAEKALVQETRETQTARVRVFRDSATETEYLIASPIKLITL